MNASHSPFIRIYGRIEEIIFLRYVYELSLLDFAPKEYLCSTRLMTRTVPSDGTGRL